MTSLLLDIAIDHPSFAGHFPGRPILPGAALLAELTEAMRADAPVREAMGEAPRLGAVKFTAPCGPGARLRLDWQLLGRRIDFRATRLDEAGETVAASGHFEVTPK